MNIEELKRMKTQLGITNQKLAELSGVPLGTVQKVLAGVTKAPRRETMQLIEDALVQEEISRKLKSSHLYEISKPVSCGVGEAKAAYGVKKQYTLEDYLALPDDVRVELIDGVFYDMSAPTTDHQSIAGYVYYQLMDHVLKHKGKCRPFISPVDVQLDRDNKTIVQPDVLIVCDRDKLDGGKRVFGAPDFVLEVLSPSTRKKDMQLKLFKYGNAGVREYWIVDQERRRVTVFDLEHDEPPMVYTFTDKIPVLIWNGECVIDFAQIDAYVSS